MALLSTVTHARLRAAQGDLAAARRILREVLEAAPGDVEARELLATWTGRVGTAGLAEPAEALGAPTAASAADLSGEFRRALGGVRRQSRDAAALRLARWLAVMRGEARS